MSTPASSAPPLGPSACLDSFINALAEPDLDRAAASFTRRACLLTPGGTAVHGRAEIALILAQLIEAGIEIEAGQLVAHDAGEVAFLSAEWTIRSRAPGGFTTTFHTSPTAVLQCLEDTWKIAFLSPWESR